MTNKIVTRHIQREIKNRNGHKVVGLALLLFGIFWIAYDLEWIPASLNFVDIAWPLALCFLGVFMMAGIKNRKL